MRWPLVSCLALCWPALALAACNITCPVGEYKYKPPQNNSNATCSACPAGTYNSQLAYAPISGCVDCPAGTYSLTPHATNASFCLPCPLGTYSILPGRETQCPACPANSYCANPTTSQPCPSNTHSPAGSTSVLQCRCDAGYVCSYTKRISATVVLNSTLSDFNTNTGNVQTNFINALALAAGVSPSNVLIDRVTGGSGGGRRLMMMTAAHTNLRTVNVHAYIEGTDRLTDFDARLRKTNPDLHISHYWSEAHKLTSRRRVPQTSPNILLANKFHASHI